MLMKTRFSILRLLCRKGRKGPHCRCVVVADRPKWPCRQSLFANSTHFLLGAVVHRVVPRHRARGTNSACMQSLYTDFFLLVPTYIQVSTSTCAYIWQGQFESNMCDSNFCFRTLGVQKEAGPVSPLLPRLLFSASRRPLR